MIRLLANSSLSTHFDTIEQLIKECEEVYIAVAFLKQSGIKHLSRYFTTKRSFTIIAGANFGLTEPDALTALLNFGKNKKVKAYLNKLDSKTIFHPKMYLFKSGKTGHIVVGSANLTQGGLKDNDEYSLYHQCQVSDPIWTEAVKNFNSLVSAGRADPLSERIISIYRKYYKKQRASNETVEAFADVDSNVVYNLGKLKSWLDQMDRVQLEGAFKAKRGHYEEAKKVLDEIGDKNHTPRIFAALVEELVGKAGQPGWWHSNGMFRHKTEIFQQQPAFRQLVNTIRENIKQPPALIYDAARALTKDIRGVGPNFIGEMMMTYSPKSLANINRNPLTVLREEGDADIKSHSQLFDGSDYQEYNNIVTEITQKLGLNDMLEADYFFNNIYQELKKRN